MFSQFLFDKTPKMCNTLTTIEEGKKKKERKKRSRREMYLLLSLNFIVGH